ncbi:MAG: PCRF domain-containing protein, partial [Deltaproteobacteria bacterium]|nr:PCRF domain-containing protein [Deltaproteobacteria bacterium]
MEDKFRKLEDIEKRYGEIAQSLSEEQVYTNIELFTRLSKEKSDLEETVSTYSRYKKIIEEIKSNELLLEDDEFKQLAREEMERLEAEKEAVEQRLMAILLPVDPRDRKNVFLEIRAGTGGEEAALFAADLFRMYARFCETRRWRIEIMSESATDRGGLKEIIASIEGERVYSFLKFESGVHRVQRVPVTEAQGRIHTSAVTVAVLPEAEDVAIEIDEKDLRIDVYRASGAGGQ